MHDNFPEDEQRFLHFLTLWTASSAMIGICLTAIGIVGILNTLSKTQGTIDELLAFASVLFLTSTILSYVGVRVRRLRHRPGFVIAVDLVFVTGLILVVVSAMLIAWLLL
jgi:hypothetical protein